MAYLGDYETDVKEVERLEKIVKLLKSVPSFALKMKDIEFANHVANIVATKCDMIIDHDTMVCSIYTELFGVAFTAVERTNLLKSLLWLRNKGLVKKYSKYDWLINRVFRFLREARK